MPSEENNAPSSTPNPPTSRRPSNALQWGPRKKPCASDPLVHHGRHFGRTVHALSNVHKLLLNGILRAGERADEPEESFTPEERREHRVYETLLKMIPNLEERLMNSSEEEIAMIADLLQKGASGARSDDTKSLKSAIIDWITPRGQSLNPPIARNIKMDRGFNHEVTGALLCPTGLDWTSPELRISAPVPPSTEQFFSDRVKEQLRSGVYMVAGDQWPVFVYKDCQYDRENPWAGLFRSTLLVSAYKHIFTSPSSVDKEPKATRSGNARIHGMTSVTPASLAYAATQARFALTSSAVFTRSDTVTDSERFYDSMLDLFDDPEERVETNDLFLWWNRQIFPSSSSSKRPITKDSALARIKEKRAAQRMVALDPRN